MMVITWAVHAIKRASQRLGNSNPKSARAPPPTLIFDACATISPHNPCSLSQLNLHSNTQDSLLLATLRHRLNGNVVSLNCIADRTSMFAQYIHRHLTLIFMITEAWNTDSASRTQINGQ